MFAFKNTKKIVENMEIKYYHFEELDNISIKDLISMPKVHESSLDIKVHKKNIYLPKLSRWKNVWKIY